jgi:hypothetical protein
MAAPYWQHYATRVAGWQCSAGKTEIDRKIQIFQMFAGWYRLEIYFV